MGNAQGKEFSSCGNQTNNTEDKRGMGMEIKKNYMIMMRELREDHDLRQKEVADYLNIDQRVYSRYETGINAMPIEKMLLLCELYHVSADYLLGRDSVKRRR